jgi:2-methylcitrate dehydratase PrpD
VRTTPTVKDHVGWEYEPTDVMSAQANIQYAVATLLVDEEVAVDAYLGDAIRRGDVLDRINDISVVVDESLEKTTFGSTVEVTYRGETYENAVHTPLGYPDNPMSDDEIEAKFRNQASKALPSASVDRIVDLVADLETLDDVSELIACCQGETS